MTVEQALTRLRIVEDMFIGDYPRSSYLYKDTFEVAEKSLKKQIPCEPSKVEHSYEAYRCNCGACVGVWSINHEQIVKSDYCPKCGQKQDWSETNAE